MTSLAIHTGLLVFIRQENIAGRIRGIGQTRKQEDSEADEQTDTTAQAHDLPPHGSPGMTPMSQHIHTHHVLS